LGKDFQQSHKLPFMLSQQDNCKLDLHGRPNRLCKWGETN